MMSATDDTKPKPKPERQSLEWRIWHKLLRAPLGITRKSLDLRFRFESPQDIDAALTCLLATKLVTCSNGLWWAR